MSVLTVIYKKAAFWAALSNDILSHPYVGITQIRLSVEGHTFLSVRNTNSRL